MDADSRVTALELSIAKDFGAYCFYPANYMARVVAMMLTDPYGIADYAYDVRAVLTNECSAGPMRAPMAITSWVMDGTLDTVAHELGLAPVAVRRRNMLAAAGLPYTMPTGRAAFIATWASTRWLSPRLWVGVLQGGGDRRVGA